MLWTWERFLLASEWERENRRSAAPAADRLSEAPPATPRGASCFWILESNSRTCGPRLLLPRLRSPPERSAGPIDRGQLRFGPPKLRGANDRFAAPKHACTPRLASRSPLRPRGEPGECRL